VLRIHSRTLSFLHLRVHALSCCHKHPLPQAHAFLLSKIDEPEEGVKVVTEGGMGRRMAHQPIPPNPALFSKLYVSLQVSPLVHACVSKEQATPHLLQSFNVCMCVCVKEQRLRGETSWTNSSMEPTHKKRPHIYTRRRRRTAQRAS